MILGVLGFCVLGLGAPCRSSRHDRRHSRTVTDASRRARGGTSEKNRKGAFRGLGFRGLGFRRDV